MEYKNSDLTKNIDAKGYAYEYTYDDNHNVTKIESQTHMNYNYTYSTKGLATSLEVKCYSKVTDVGILKSEVTYDSNGLLSSATDQDGNKVEYKYDGNKGTLTQTTDKLDSKNPVVTDYTYDSNTDQIKSVKQSDSNGNEYSIAYSYSSKSKLLEKISRDGTDYSIKYDEFGNKIDSKVGSQSLASYSYGANNGPILSSTYGTGQNVSYAYDEFGNVKTRKYNGKTAFNWYSDRGGNIIRENDYLNKRLTDFTYDTTGRLVRQTVADSSVTGSSNKLLFGFEYSYDLNNNITQVVTKTTDKTVKNKFTFGKDNLLKTFALSTGKKVDYTYDGLNRLTKTSLTTSADKPIDTTYTYFASKRGSDYTTTKLKSETINGEKYEYKYDAHSNITDVTKDGVLQYHYGYDMMNQLVSVDDKLNGKVYNYTYDAGGNLISETVTDSNGTTSNAYEYNNSNWGDVLTSYNGQNITYDEIGNPLTYRDGMSMTWKNGRQLATLTNGDTSISYGYDSDSVRTTKTVNGVKYTYAYLNGQLLYETRGDAKFYYSYDANGILYNVRYTLTDGGTEYSYYYTHNSRGDIIGIYNGAGELKAHYEYDAWGNVISITDNNGNVITNPNHIGNLNPFRYRGYYQDTETGLYYLMSRYYDPITHRFINADGYFQSGTSILEANTFAYCGNNPTSFSDSTGTFFLESVVFGFGAGLICNVAGQLLSGVGFSNIDWGSAVISGLTGAVLGGIDLLGLGVMASSALKGGVSFWGSMVNSACHGDDFELSLGEAAVNGLVSVGFSIASGGNLSGSRYENTSISDAEVVYEEQAGHFWHIKYPIAGTDRFLEIATTRPETLLGDTAIAVHPDDERYKDIVGKMAILPLVNREIPIVADYYVDKEFGTGAVKITPAHDPNDFEVGKRHNLPEINIMNDDATINEKGGKYAGMDRYEARKAIVADLDEQGYLVKVVPHMHAVGTHDRCGTTVEPLIKQQWFVKMLSLIHI